MLILPSRVQELLFLVDRADRLLALVPLAPDTRYHLRAALDAIRARPRWPGAAARYHLRALCLDPDGEALGLGLAYDHAGLSDLPLIGDPGQSKASLLGGFVRALVRHDLARAGQLSRMLALHTTRAALEDLQGLARRRLLPGPGGGGDSGSPAQAPPPLAK